jgi:GDP-4-dehydro-6-deoxy-D-mannose reductase
LDAYWKILLKGKSGEIYNVCCGKSFHIDQILTYLIEKSSKSLQIRVRNECVRKDDIPDIYGDNSKLKSDTGWAPIIGFLDSLNRMF